MRIERLVRASCCRRQWKYSDPSPKELTAHRHIQMDCAEFRDKIVEVAASAEDPLSTKVEMITHFVMEAEVRSALRAQRGEASTCRKGLPRHRMDPLRPPAESAVHDHPGPIHLESS